MAFTRICYDGIFYNLVGTKNDAFVTVQNDSDSEKSSILMHVDVENGIASIANFFYLDGSIDKKLLFDKLVECKEKERAGAFKTMVHDVMDILLLTALYLKCSVVLLYDIAQKDGYRLCNDKYRPPDYLNYYTRHYGFIHSRDVDYALKNETGESFVGFRRTTMEEALERGRGEKIENELASQKTYGPLDRKLEYIVSRYYAFFKHEKKKMPSTKLPSCSGYMVKYMDPIENRWLDYGMGDFHIQRLTDKIEMRGTVLYIN